MCTINRSIPERKNEIEMTFSNKMGPFFVRGIEHRDQFRTRCSMNRNVHERFGQINRCKQLLNDQLCQQQIHMDRQKRFWIKFDASSASCNRQMIGSMEPIIDHVFSARTRRCVGDSDKSSRGSKLLFSCPKKYALSP